MMSLLEREQRLFLPTYKRIPIDISYGKGAYLYDTTGMEYLDFFSGLAVNALGYAHPKIIAAVTRQVGLFAHLSNNYITTVQADFAEKLLRYSGMSAAFLTNSGTESIEGTIKLIRKKYGPDKMIYSLSGAFHGRTYGALSLTHKEKYQKGFAPLVPNTGMLQHNAIEDLRSKVDGNCAAVFVEFIQGEGGIHEVTAEWTTELLRLRNQYGFAIVSDCIQCGIGRTGKPFSHEWHDLKPDIIVTAKAIGGGLPLGAFLVSDELKSVLTAGVHGTTFGGNPVCCAAGLVVLEEVFENGLMEQTAELGKYFKGALEQLAEKYPEYIKTVRGKGYMLGVELQMPGAEIVEKMFDWGVLTNCTADNVIRILPPLIAGKDEIDRYLSAFEDVLYNLKF